MRELKNRVARLVAFGAQDEVSAVVAAEQSPAATSTESPPESSTASLFERVLEKELPLARARELVVGEFEKAYVERVLAQHGGSVAKAAAASGLARRYFQLLRAKRAPRP